LYLPLHSREQAPVRRRRRWRARKRRGWLSCWTVKRRRRERRRRWVGRSVCGGDVKMGVSQLTGRVPYRAAVTGHLQKQRLATSGDPGVHGRVAQQVRMQEEVQLAQGSHHSLCHAVPSARLTHSRNLGWHTTERRLRRSTLFFGCLRVHASRERKRMRRMRKEWRKGWQALR
jgi:hypothetical protein